MAENVQITPGTGVTIGADSVTDVTLGSAQIQYIKIMDGTIGGTNKAGVTANGLAVDGSATTQPISAVSLPLPTGASTSANQTTIGSQTTKINDGTNTVAVKAASAAAAPTDPALVVAISPNNTVAVTQGTSPWIVSLASTTITGTVAVTQSGVWSIGRTWDLASGTDSVSAIQSGTWNIGTLTSITNPVAVTGTFFQTTQPISAISLPLPTGAATSANQTNASQKTQIVDGSGNVVASTSNALNVDVTNFPATTAVTQSTSPWVISGTVTANAGTGNFTVVQPTGTNLHVVVDTAPTTAVTQSGTWTVQPGNTPNTTPWLMTIEQGGNAATVTASNALKVDGSAVTQPVSGTITANAGTGTFAENLTQIAGNAIATAASGIAKIGLTDGLGNAITSTTNGSTQELNVVIPDANTSGTISALNGTVVLTLLGSGSCEVYISGTFSATLNVQGTIDGTNWNTLLTSTGSMGTYSTAAFSTIGKYRVFRTAALTQVRVIATTYTSGTINVLINASQPVDANEIVQQTAANLLTQSWTFDGSGNAISSNSGALNENLTQVGGVSVAATAKGTQASNFVPVQDAKDSGRTYVTFTADAIAGVTSETLVTFTLNKQGTTTGSETNYTITNGKTLRITSIALSAQSGAGAGSWVRLKLRHNLSGATTTSSGLVYIVETGSPVNATAISGAISVPIPDGLEFYGDGTQTIGITHISSATTDTESITVCGYEY